MTTTLPAAALIAESDDAPLSPPPPRRQRGRGLAAHLQANWLLYVLLIPGILYFALFRFYPMYGASIAFKDYIPFLGTEGSPWVGFKHFENFFTNPDFPRLLANTLIIAALSLFIAFPVTIVDIWKNTGWGTIIFLAALAGVDQEQYEAAIIDGAGRWHRVRHITLPSIQSTIVIVLILQTGQILNTGFEQIYLMSNSLNRSVADVFDTYVYFVGIAQGAYSYSTAVGLAKAIVGVLLVFGTNWLAKRLTGNGIF